MRPLKGLDPNLYENLESTFRQEYPNYEVFFAVSDEHDQALGVVRDLIAKYPHVNAHVLIGEENIGVNPKVNNLVQAYRQAAHDIIWVLDSNVMVDPGTLARSVDALDGPSSVAQPKRKRIALVHHVPFAFATEAALGSHVEQAFLNTNHAKMYIAINTVAIDSCVNGKSNLYRRSDLERVDGTLKPVSSSGSTRDKGLPAFGRFLAEDNMIGLALWHELDVRHDLSCDVAHNAVGSMSLADYFWRRVRWIRVRKYMAFAATMAEPFTESIVAGCIAAASLHYLLGFPIWLFFPLHFLTWLLVDLDVYESLAGHPVPPGLTRWKFIGAWALREGLALLIWSYAIWGSTVDWRGKKYVVMRNGEVRKAGRDDVNKWQRWIHRTSSREDVAQYEPIELAQD
ncbi:glycosyltransferase family 21 protein [Phanerochaete carnosa HHB-10118-sp]|uniref:Ceramide glucosyltransferase n=1 Tax=Phanerochaete carnosa (strain HHB-10118-sp) TaxID=650164 RepID=K5WPF7_PHACS|nr:glycosyltransferase family 21 protein [Phanerochaete carnosa HHB-10118-sp]EKM61310.1 glycosyltransferase family 21 protein [Phanerochaete carnosa HHB-10118-sp]